MRVQVRAIAHLSWNSLIHWSSYIVSYSNPIKYPILNNNVISRRFIVHINLLPTYFLRFYMRHSFFESILGKTFILECVSSDVLLISSYISLLLFKEIFCWIAWVTFKWIVVLFSFCFNSCKTMHAKIAKKSSKKSHWLNNIHLLLISRLNLCAPKSPCS